MQVLEQILHIQNENNGNNYSSSFLGIFRFKIDYSFDNLMQSWVVLQVAWIFIHGF
jgi:hypothetical protein